MNKNTMEWSKKGAGEEGEGIDPSQLMSGTGAEESLPLVLETMWAVKWLPKPGSRRIASRCAAGRRSAAVRVKARSVMGSLSCVGGFSEWSGGRSGASRRQLRDHGIADLGGAPPGLAARDEVGPHGLAHTFAL